MAIPECISREDILRALRQISRGGVPPERYSTGYCLEYEGRHFAPKYVVSCVFRTKLASVSEESDHPVGAN